MKIYKDTRRQKQANTIKGDGNPNWKGGQFTKLCVRCGFPFLVYPSQCKYTHCSLLCANRDMADAQRGVVNPRKIHCGKDNGMYGVSLPQKKGAESRAWKGGITPFYQAIRTCKSYDEWRLMIFGRDNYTCQKCGKRGCYLEAHHIKTLLTIVKIYGLTNLMQCESCNELWNIDNGVTLCKDCHKQTENYCGRARIPSA